MSKDLYLDFFFLKIPTTWLQSGFLQLKKIQTKKDLILSDSKIAADVR